MKRLPHTFARLLFPDHPPTKLTYIALLLVSLIAAFATRYHYLYLGYFQDDYSSLRQPGLTFSGLSDILSPTRIGWFYRPVMVIYVRFMNLLTQSSVPRHAVSIALFGIISWLQSSLLVRLTKSRLSGWICLLFIMTTSVAEEAIWWYASTSTLFAALFSLCAIHCWISWRRRNIPVWGGLAYAFVVLAMCSKEDAASLPAILAVIDLIVLPFSGWKSFWKRTAPLILWTAIWLVLDMTAYKHFASSDQRARVHETSILPALRSLYNSLNTNLFIGIEIGLAKLPVASSIPALIFTALIAAYRLRGERLLGGIALCFLLATIPVPLLTGHHAVSGRFNFLPMCWSVTLYTFLAMRAIQSARLITRICGFIVLPLVNFLPISDPNVRVNEMLYLIPAACILCVIAAYYYKPARTEIAVFTVCSAISVGLFMAGPDAAPIYYLIPIFAGCLFGLYRERAIDWTLFAAICVVTPVVGLYALVGGLLINSFKQEKLGQVDPQT